MPTNNGGRSTPFPYGADSQAEADAIARVVGAGGVVDLGAIREQQIRASVPPRAASEHKVRVELGPTAEPCYKCPCCAAWNDALNTFRQVVLNHDNNARRRRACPPNCQVCALAQGAYDAGDVEPTDEPS